MPRAVVSVNCIKPRAPEYGFRASGLPPLSKVISAFSQSAGILSAVATWFNACISIVGFPFCEGAG